MNEYNNCPFSSKQEGYFKISDSCAQSFPQCIPVHDANHSPHNHMDHAEGGNQVGEEVDRGS